MDWETLNPDNSNTSDNTNTVLLTKGALGPILAVQRAFIVVPATMCSAICRWRLAGKSGCAASR